MAEIVGTITNLSDFLSKTQVCLSVKPNDPQQQIICLEADRKYSIPAFQREVRWDDNNLKMLLYDTQFNIVTVKHKLLGYWWHLRPEDSASIRRALSWSRLCYSILATMILCCLRMELKPLTPMR